MIFCSDVGLKILSESNRWHSDGTFETAVKFQEDKFQQFYFIHGKYKGVLLPCAFALLTNKTITTFLFAMTTNYNCRLFSEFKEGARKIRLVFKLRNS